MVRQLVGGYRFFTLRTLSMALKRAWLSSYPCAQKRGRKNLFLALNYARELTRLAATQAKIIHRPYIYRHIYIYIRQLTILDIWYALTLLFIQRMRAKLVHRFMKPYMARIYTYPIVEMGSQEFTCTYKQVHILFILPQIEYSQCSYLCLATYLFW